MSVWPSQGETLDSMDTETLEVCDSSDEEDEIYKIKHRKSMIRMEQSLMEPCDQSPIVPERLRLESSCTQSGGSNSLERLLMERMLLRKELRLRKMQERLLEQDKRIEELEAKLKELESVAGFRCFQSISRCFGNAFSASERGYEFVRLGIQCLLSALYQALFVCFLNYIPSSLSMSGAAMVQRAGTIMAQRAENFSNECMENMEWDSEKSSSLDTSSRRARGNQPIRRRRR